MTHRAQFQFVRIDEIRCTEPIALYVHDAHNWREGLNLAIYYKVFGYSIGCSLARLTGIYQELVSGGLISIEEGMTHEELNDLFRRDAEQALQRMRVSSYDAVWDEGLILIPEIETPQTCCRIQADKAGTVSVWFEPFRSPDEIVPTPVCMSWEELHWILNVNEDRESPDHPAVSLALMLIGHRLEDIHALQLKARDALHPTLVPRGSW